MSRSILSLLLVWAIAFKLAILGHQRIVYEMPGVSAISITCRGVVPRMGIIGN